MSIDLLSYKVIRLLFILTTVSVITKGIPIDPNNAFPKIAMPTTWNSQVGEKLISETAHKDSSIA